MEPARIAALRGACRMRTQTLVEELQAMVEQGQVERTPDGFRLRD